MSIDIDNTFKYRPPEAVKQAELISAQIRLKANIENQTNPNEILEDILKFDRMGKATVPAALDTWRKIPRIYPDVKTFLVQDFDQAHNNGDDERALDNLRASLLLGLAYLEPQNLVERFRSRLPNYEQTLNPDADSLWQYHKTQLEQKQAAAQAAAAASANPAPGPTPPPPPPPPGAGAGPSRPRRAAGTNPGPSNPNTGPATNPNTTAQIRTAWDPENLTGKSAEWVTAWQDAEKRWKVIEPTLPTGTAPANVEVWFKAAMQLLNETITGKVPLATPDEDTNNKALVDFWLTRVFPNPAIMRKFLNDKQYNAIPSNLPRCADLKDLSTIARDVFITPTTESAVKPTRTQWAEIRKIHRVLARTVQYDAVKREPNASQNLIDMTDELFKAIESNWTKFEHLDPSKAQQTQANP